MAWLGGMAGSGTRGVAMPRQHERFQTHGLACALGDVVDLSASGMKVTCRKKPAVRRGDVLEFSIRSGSQKVSLVGRVAWTRRASWREHRVGVQFIGVKPGVAEALVELAMHGFISGKKSGARFTMGAESPSGGKRSGGVRASVEIEDLYQILGVRRDATDEEIRAAYRKAAMACHPDVSSDPDAEKKFALISKAHAILGDAEKRDRYNDLLAQAAFR